MIKVKYKLNEKKIVIGHLLLLALAITALTYSKNKNELILVVLFLVYNSYRYLKNIYKKEYYLIITEDEILFWSIFPSVKNYKIETKKIQGIEISPKILVKKGVFLTAGKKSFFMDLTYFNKDEQEQIVETLKSLKILKF